MRFQNVRKIEFSDLNTSRLQLKSINGTFFSGFELLCSRIRCGIQRFTFIFVFDSLLHKLQYRHGQTVRDNLNRLQKKKLFKCAMQTNPNKMRQSKIHR